MATAEAPPGTLGPRYAPDDPTLPEPWKGLIDGNTGVKYYWNPETNATQYEKPPPLPSRPPPATPTPKMNPLPATRSSQPDNIQTPQNQQTVQTQFTQGQLTSSSFQQHTQATQVAPPVQAQSQMMQQPGQHAPMQPVQQGFTQPMQPGQQQAPYQLMQSMPHLQQGQMYPGAQMGPPHGFQFTHQPTQYTVHQRNMPPQGPQSSSQQLPHQEHKAEHGQIDSNDFHQAKQPGFAQANQTFMQGQQYPHTRDQKTGNPQRDDVEFQQVNQAGFSPAQIQNTGMPPLQNMSSGVNSSHGHKMSIQLNQSVEYGGPRPNMQRNNPSIHMPQMGAEPTHPHNGSRFQNQMGPGMMHGQQQNLPHPGSKMPYEENHPGRPGNEYIYNTAKDVNAMSPQLPKLSPLPPSARNQQQEARMGDFPSQNPPHSLPGRFSGPGGPALPGVVHGHSSGAPTYPNNTFVRPPLSMMGPSDPMHLSAAEIYRQKHEVTATGDDVPAPFMTFEATGFPPEILQEVSTSMRSAISAPKEEHMSYTALHFAGFSAPTPIQAQTWPIALQNRDIVAIAKTGSGKTLGYLMPAFIHLRRRRNNPQNGPTVLVLSPTRELATQIQDEAIKFGRSSRVSCTCLYGGAPKGPQLKELDRGADIVVATPGRLNDILEMKRIDFRQVSFLVLDEADRMLDMGFEPQIRKIVNEIPPRRQTLMYTATWPKEVRKIAGDLLVNPVQVNIGSVDELAANKSITQYVEVVPEFDKQRRLEQILRSQERGSKIIIFCSTKKLCDHLARNLGRNFGAAAIHGDKSQGERDWVLNQFRSGKSPVLVATDVAARGLDIRDIRVVINYDFPTGIEDYVHRIGRTGRAGATGIAHTFFSEQDWKHAPDLVKLLEGANQAVPPEVRDIAMRGGPTFSRDRGPVNRYDSGGFGGRGGGGRWDSGGRRGGRDGGFGGRGGMRDGGRGGWDRGGRVGPQERFNSMDTRGRGRGRGRDRFDGRRDGADRSRGRSYSSSPERVRTWGGYSRSRSRSYSRSRSRSRSWSRSRSRSWSRSRSRSRSPRSRSRSRSYERYERRPRVSKFDVMDPNAEVSVPVGVGAGRGNGGVSGAESAEQGGMRQLWLATLGKISEWLPVT
ncbi:DEAD-box ATP-dependent RNA helicase, partial [Striga asiatica]